MMADTAVEQRQFEQLVGMELDVASCIRDGQYSMFDDGSIERLLAENGILAGQDTARATDTGRQAPPASQHQPQGPREQRDDGPVASGAFSQRPPEQPPSSQDSNAGLVSLGMSPRCARAGGGGSAAGVVMVSGGD